MLTASHWAVYVWYVAVQINSIVTIANVIHSVHKPCKHPLDSQRDWVGLGYNWTVRDDAMHLPVCPVLLHKVRRVVVCSKCIGTQLFCICSDLVFTSHV
jgi:hypothetical protein